MSETDDTEKLLLIPPNLFIESSSESCDSVLRKSISLSKRSEQKHLENISRKVDNLKLCLQKLESVSCSDCSSINDLKTSFNARKSNIPNKQRSSVLHKNTAKNRSYIGKKHLFSSKSTKLHLTNSIDPFSSKNVVKSCYSEFNGCTSPKKKYLFDLESFSNIDFESSSECSIVSYLSLASLNMDSDNSALSTPFKKQDNTMLSEIDTFLNNINKIKIGDDTVDEYSNLGASKLQSVSRKIDLEQGYSPTKPITLDMSTQNDSSIIFTPDFSSKYSNWRRFDELTTEKPCTTREIVKEGDLKDTVPNLGFGMRDIMYPESSTISVETPVAKKAVGHDDCEKKPHSNKDVRDSTKIEQRDSVIRQKKYLDSFKGLENSPQSHKTKVSEKNKQSVLEDFLTSCTSERKKYELATMNQSDNFNTGKSRTFEMSGVQNMSTDSEDLKLENRNMTQSEKQQGERHNTLPSLSNLWRVSDTIGKKREFNIQRFEEEKMRREHCESIIHDLQKKSLEQQQKLAIAVQVDAAKDEAIVRLRNALLTVTQKLSSAQENHNQDLTKADVHLKSVFLENEELKKMIDLEKSETMKAVQSLHTLQDKYQLLNNEKAELVLSFQNEIERCKEIIKNKEDLFNELKNSNALVIQLNKQISESANNLQSNLEKMRDDNIQVKEELTNSQKVCESLKDDISVLKTDMNNLNLKLSEEKSRNTHLDTQKAKLQTMLDGANKKLKSLEMEFESFKNQAEEQKNEMKTYYQRQVENIVLSKLNEFQKQLNTAESLMDNEMQNKEKEIAMQFAKQLHKLEQQHKLEVNILEEKQKEEIKLYRIQLAQSSQTITQLEESLASYKNRRGQIAAQLHSVMESQWQQALKIITNGAQGDGNHSSSVIGVQSSNESDTHGQKEYQNNPNFFKDLKYHREYNNRISQMLKKCEEQLSRKDSNSNNIVSMPSVSKDKTKDSNGQAQLNDEDIHRYVKMLLQRSPGVNDLMESTSRSAEKKTGSSQSDQRTKVLQTDDDDQPTSDKNNDTDRKMYNRHLHLKPPWK